MVKMQRSGISINHCQSLAYQTQLDSFPHSYIRVDKFKNYQSLLDILSVPHPYPAKYIRGGDSSISYQTPIHIRLNISEVGTPRYLISPPFISSKIYQRWGLLDNSTDLYTQLRCDLFEIYLGGLEKDRLFCDPMISDHYDRREHGVLYHEYDRKTQRYHARCNEYRL